ncbi:MAG: hypothetical protein WD824_09700 [Cyclobacteriaceae bacterium]
MTKWLTIFLVSSFTAGSQINADEIVKVNSPGVIVKAGNHSMINVAIEVKNGYHIQANKVDNEFIIPTTLEMSYGKDIIVKKQVFPSAKKFRLEGTNEYLDVYDGRFEIGIFFRTQKEIQKGIHRLDGKLNFQACDSIRCLSPRGIEFSMEIEVR